MNRITSDPPQPSQRIIVDQLHGHWSAWFAVRPESAFGGDSPGTAVDRLWGAYLQDQESGQ